MINENYIEKTLFIKNGQKKSFHKILTFAQKIRKITLLVFIILICIIESIFLFKKIFFSFYNILINNEPKNIEIKKNISIEEQKKNKKSDFFIKQINEYIILCRNGTLINSFKTSQLIPKITAIIPVYNAAKTLKSTIRSIQNQNMNDIEIILVDDNSSDNSIEIINQLQQEDYRIKLITNKKSRGTLYSRSIGALNSKGKYIMAIDNDDLFINNIFKICYDEAEKYQIDIIEFLGFNIPKSSLVKINSPIPYFLRFIPSGIIRQPQLSTAMFTKSGISFKEIDAYVWGKCIKTEIYKKTLEIIGSEIYSQHVCWTEDRIFNFGLFRVANSFKKIDAYGIIYIDNPSSIGHNWPKIKYNKVIHDQLIYIINTFNLTKNSKDVRIAAYLFIKKWGRISKGLNEENKILAKNIYNNLINCTNVSEYRKNIIIKLVKNELY